MARGGAFVSSCEPSAWRGRNNTGPSVLVVVEDWLNTGLGHQIAGMAAWIALMISYESHRALRFAPCVPARLRTKFRDRAAGRNVAACEQGDIFALTDHFGVAGVYGPLRATDAELDAAHADNSLQGRREQSPARIDRLFEDLLHDRGGPPVVALTRPHMIHVLRLARRRGIGAAHSYLAPACIRRVRPVRPLAAPPCEVGLHVRTLTLDDPRCESSVIAGDPQGGSEGCPGHLRGRMLRRQSSPTCQDPTSREGMPLPLPLALDGCGGARGLRLFATSDSPNTYSLTRPLGWSDLNETPALTWTWSDGQAPLAATSALQETARAWWVLANCTRAIVAPMSSAFSIVASLAANVPLHYCCAELQQAWQQAGLKQQLAAAEQAQRVAEAEAARLRQEIARTEARLSCEPDCPKPGHTAARRARRFAFSNAALRLTRERTAAADARREASLRWQRSASPGFCAVTEQSPNASSCVGGKGSWRMPAHVGTSWPRAGRWCEARCRGCARCRYISLSLRFQDCSWFAHCDLARLKAFVDGFYSLEPDAVRT